ncbi:MAG: hypothetical protein WC856_26520 [Methylococcaceae bacterium]|jgi:hypothetical protein
MTKEFKAINIVSLDDTASSSSDPNSTLVNIVLNLSSSAPHEWASYFNERWQSHIYMMKRRASVSGNRLNIYCVPEELQNDHLPELKTIIEETNQAYRQFLAQKERVAATEMAKNETEKAKLHPLLKRVLSSTKVSNLTLKRD